MINLTSTLTPKFFNDGMMLIPDGILFNGHIQTAFILFGFWGLDMLLDVTLWQYIRPIRNTIRDKIKSVFKSIKNKLF